MSLFSAPAFVAPALNGAVPPCPNAQVGFDHEVRTYAGAGGERRTYNCTCGMTWNQKRPDKMAPGEDPDVRQSNRAALGGSKRSAREYKCGNCGAPKKGHVCTVGADVKKARTSPPPVDPPVAAVSSLWREQYDDMLKFSTPPTDAEVLGFLRKYDLKPSEATDLYKSMKSYQVVDDPMLSSSVDIAAAMTQIAGNPVDTETDAIATAEAGSALPDEEIVAVINGEETLGELSVDDFMNPCPPEAAIDHQQEAGELLLDELLNLGKLDTCADCTDALGADRKTCNCGKTTVHRFCFKLCEHCG